jgi:hypothetical protein
MWGKLPFTGASLFTIDVVGIHAHHSFGFVDSEQFIFVEHLFRVASHLGLRFRFNFRLGRRLYKNT